MCAAAMHPGAFIKVRALHRPAGEVESAADWLMVSAHGMHGSAAVTRPYIEEALSSDIH